MTCDLSAPMELKGRAAHRVVRRDDVAHICWRDGFRILCTEDHPRPGHYHYPVQIKCQCGAWNVVQLEVSPRP